MNPASFISAGSLPSRFRWRVARLSCGLRAIELHEHRIVDLVLKRLGDSDQIRFMRLFTHQRSTPRPMDHRFRGRALVRSPGDPGGVSTFLRGEVITPPPPQARPYDSNVYFSQAPLRTNDHVVLLREVADRTDGGGLPRFVEREFREFLTCGALRRGFAHVRCEGCAYERLVPFSCKRG